MKNLILIMFLVLSAACSTTFERNEGTEHNGENFKVLKTLQTTRSGI